MTDAKSGDETQRPGDIQSLHTTEYTAAVIKSNLFHGDIFDDDWSDDLEFGIQVHQDGRDIALSAGSLWTPEETNADLHTYHGLTVEQARDLATSLEEAADTVEERQNEAESAATDDGGLIQRLIRNV